MAMVGELREVFPYFPMPNYPWARMTANVLHTMRREREVYMECATRVAGSEEDVEMASAREDMIPTEPVEEIAVDPRVETPVERMVPQDVVPQSSGGGPTRPCVTKTYLKKSAGTVGAETKGPSVTAELCHERALRV